MLYKILLVFVLFVVHHVGGVSDHELIARNCRVKSHSPHVRFNHDLSHLTSHSVIYVANSMLTFHKIKQGLENVSIVGYNNPTVYYWRGLQFDS